MSEEFTKKVLMNLHTEMMRNKETYVKATIEYYIALINYHAGVRGISKIALTVLYHMAPYTRMGVKFDYTYLTKILFQMGFRSLSTRQITAKYHPDSLGYFTQDSEEVFYIGYALLRLQNESKVSHGLQDTIAKKFPYVMFNNNY